MPHSYNDVGSKSQGETIAVTFPFLSRDHVSVEVDGVAVASNLWEWTSDSLITCLSGFPSGTVTRVKRTTPEVTIPASQSGTGAFDYEGANENDQSNLYILQEEIDRADEDDSSFNTNVDARIAAAVGVSVQAHSVILEGTTASFTTTLKTKLDGIASGATVNSSDAALRARSSHTGTQSSSTIDDFDAAVDARADARISEARGVSIQPFSSILNGTTASFTTALKSKLDGVDTGATANASDASLRDRSTHTGDQLAATISDFSTSVDARIGVSLPGLGVANTFTQNQRINPGAAACILYLEQTGTTAVAWELKNNQTTGRLSFGITGGTDPLKIAHDGVENCLRIGITANNVCDFAGPIKLANYTVATLPAASIATGGTVYVTDETGGAVTASSDGTNWRRSTDNAIVS